MIDNKLTEFIIKHQEFYNKLSKDSKKILQIITDFGNLETFDTHEIGTNKRNFPKCGTYYLYIGENTYYNYYYECKKELIPSKVDNKIYYSTYNISKGRIVAIRQLEDKIKKEFI